MAVNIFLKNGILVKTVTWKVLKLMLPHVWNTNYWKILECTKKLFIMVGPNLRAWISECSLFLYFFSEANLLFHWSLQIVSLLLVMLRSSLFMKLRHKHYIFRSLLFEVVLIFLRSSRRKMFSSYVLREIKKTYEHVTNVIPYESFCFCQMF